MAEHDLLRILVQRGEFVRSGVVRGIDQTRSGSGRLRERRLEIEHGSRIEGESTRRLALSQADVDHLDRGTAVGGTVRG
jgi:hypothetical protein